MKFFAALLSVFFLCLATMPCADAASTNNATVEISQHSDHDHEKPADNCTPFCHCHCCHVHVTITAGEHDLIKVEGFKDHKSNYLTFSPSSPLHSLFRPPNA